MYGQPSYIRDDLTFMSLYATSHPWLMYFSFWFHVGEEPILDDDDPEDGLWKIIQMNEYLFEFTPHYINHLPEVVFLL